MLNRRIEEIVEKDLPRINSQLTNISQDTTNKFNATELKKADKTTTSDLQSQINGLVLGSGTSSAEVVQARILEGFTFPTLKSGLDSIMNMLKSASYKVYYSCTQGDIVLGVETSSTTRLRSDFIANDMTKKEAFRFTSGYKYKVTYYNSSKVFQSEEAWRDYDADLLRPHPFYRICIAKTNDTNISLSEYDKISSIRYFDLYNTLNTSYNALNTSYNTNKTKSVKEYGAKGDGITNDTVAIQNAINACGINEKLRFPFGNYLITSTLNINKSIRIDLEGSTILSNNNVGTFIKIFSLDTSLIRDLAIENGTIDLKLLSSRGINIFDCARFTLRNLTINQFLGEGIRIGRSGLTSQCYEGFIDNIKLFGCMELATNNTVGIFVDTADCTFNNIIGTRGMGALIVNGWGGNFYSKLHGWNDFPVDRCLVKTFKECFISHSYSDCLTYGVIVAGVESFAKINQCEFLYPSLNETNKEYYAVRIEDTVLNPQDTAISQSYMRGYSLDKQELNFDTNKEINISNSTYKWANRKF